VASTNGRPGSPVAVLDELAAAKAGRSCCRRAEAVGLVQVCGGARIAGAGLRVIAGTPAAGARLAARLGELAAAPRVSVRLVPAGQLVAVEQAGPALVAALGGPLRILYRSSSQAIMSRANPGVCRICRRHARRAPRRSAVHEAARCSVVRRWCDSRSLPGRAGITRVAHDG